jgi:hypothetical protein
MTPRSSPPTPPATGRAGEGRREPASPGHQSIRVHQRDGVEVCEVTGGDVTMPSKLAVLRRARIGGRFLHAGWASGRLSALRTSGVHGARRGAWRVDQALAPQGGGRRHQPASSGPDGDRARELVGGAFMVYASRCSVRPSSPISSTATTHIRDSPRLDVSPTASSASRGDPGNDPQVMANARRSTRSSATGTARCPRSSRGADLVLHLTEWAVPRDGPGGAREGHGATDRRWPQTPWTQSPAGSRAGPTSARLAGRP